MSDPVKQGEQVEQVATAWEETLAFARSKNEQLTPTEELMLVEAYRRLAGRVRLLEQREKELQARYDAINWASRNWTNALKESQQREKGLRDLLAEWLIDHGEPSRYHERSERTRRALATTQASGEAE